MLRFFGERSAFILISGLAAIALWPQAASARYLQQGAKFSMPGMIGGANAGDSVALSADGNTAIVGGSEDNGRAGAAWIYVRNNGAWSAQQKLVATGIGTAMLQGRAVALSADGNTAIVGGPGDNSSKGAAWVWTRANGLWTMQQKLVAANAFSSAPQQGVSVALSADGNTALIGGPAESSGLGAAWVWIRSGGTWLELQKLAASGSGAGDPVGSGNQGFSVALSGDGNTAIVGAPFDNSMVGAAFVWVRSGNVWGRQGGKLVETGLAGAQEQGWSVALSADGNTALVGGPSYDGGRGAAWVWARSAGAWSWICGRLVPSGAAGSPSNGVSVALSADGSVALTGGPADNGRAGAAWVWRRIGNGCTQTDRLIGSGAVGLPAQGYSVALSATASTALVGGYGDNSYAGAAWAFLRAAAHDFSGEGASDVLWRHSSGQPHLWLMNGASYTGAPVANVSPGWIALGQRDFDNNGTADILWASGSHVVLWLMTGGTQTGFKDLGSVPGWSVAGLGDFNGDGHSDILWRNASGDNAIWFFVLGDVVAVASLGNVPTNWGVAGVADLNGDGKTDIVWRDGAGTVAVWTMNGTSATAVNVIGTIPTNWSIVGFGDLNGDARGDILWREAGGATSAWLMSGPSTYTLANYGAVGTDWGMALVGDYNGDGVSDILWRSSSGTLALWQLNAGGAVGTVTALGAVGTDWQVQSLFAN